MTMFIATVRQWLEWLVTAHVGTRFVAARRLTVIKLAAFKAIAAKSSFGNTMTQLVMVPPHCFKPKDI